MPVLAGCWRPVSDDMARPACEFLIATHKSLHAQVNVWMVMSVDDEDGMCPEYLRQFQQA